VTSTLTDRILTTLASPEWQAEPPGSGLLAEVLREPRRDVMAALRVLEADGKVTGAGGSPYVAHDGWALTSSITTWQDPHDLASLRQPLPGTAGIDADGLLTVGVHADGAPAGWQLRGGYNNNCAQHKVVIGGSGSGKTTLLRSILAAATAAGIDAQVIDPNGMVGNTGHPTATGPNDAYAALAEQHHLARTRIAAARRDRPAPGTRPLRLLVIDDLQALAFDAQADEHLRDLIRADAGAAGIALVVATQSVLALGYLGFGTRDQLLATDPVLLPVKSHTVAIAGGGGHLPPIPASLPGVGYLPHPDLPQRQPRPFRAWFPPAL
jgi:Type IV secretion-system coupling protein DNA-binding domain